MEPQMTQVACSYAALRFMPYRETGEFANVGVVVWAPEAGFFGHLSNPKLGKRLRGFFPELDLHIYREALKGSKSLLAALENQFAIKAMIGEGRHATLVDRFHELVRTREGMLTFGPTGALLAATPEKALEDLYQRLVLRQFAQQAQYQEVVMQKRLATCLRTWNLNTFYRRGIVGDDQFHVSVPFVHHVGIRAQKILRPLDLDREDTTSIYKHGDQWVVSMQRLKRFNTLPDKVVIPVHLPVAGERRNAALQVVEDFRAFGALAVSIDDQDALHEAASVVA